MDILSFLKELPIICICFAVSVVLIVGYRHFTRPKFTICPKCGSKALCCYPEGRIWGREVGVSCSKCGYVTEFIGE